MIEFKDVTKEYTKGIAALNGVNLKIEQGEFVFIVGDSGSGKSTLIRLLMKELDPTSGTIVNLKIEQGEFVFIVGDSGSGKSTLIRLLMKELDPTSGTIIVNGMNLNRMKHRHIAKYRRHLGVVFQDFRLLKDRNIYENIAFAQRVIETPTRVLIFMKILHLHSVLSKHLREF